MSATEVEQMLLDVVLRHGVYVGVDTDDFTDPYVRAVWPAVLDVVAAEGPPSLRAVHEQLLRRGVHRDDRDALRLVFLPLGHLADLEDLAALVAENGRRRRLRLGAA